MPTPLTAAGQWIARRLNNHGPSAAAGVRCGGWPRRRPPVRASPGSPVAARGASVPDTAERAARPAPGSARSARTRRPRLSRRRRPGLRCDGRRVSTVGRAGGAAHDHQSGPGPSVHGSTEAQHSMPLPLSLSPPPLQTAPPSARGLSGPCARSLESPALAEISLCSSCSCPGIVGAERRHSPPGPAGRGASAAERSSAPSPAAAAAAPSSCRHAARTAGQRAHTQLNHRPSQHAGRVRGARAPVRGSRCQHTGGGGAGGGRRRAERSGAEPS